MIDDARLEYDSDGVVDAWFLVLDDSFGVHRFQVDPQMIADALRPWHDHEFEGEVVAAERRALGAYVCADPEQAYCEMIRESADFLKTRSREGAMCDPGDHSAAA